MISTLIFIPIGVLIILLGVHSNRAIATSSHKPEKVPEIPIRYVIEGAGIHTHPQGDMIDIVTPVDVKYKKGETLFIDFGLAMRLPEGYEAHLYPRSSTFKNYGLLLTNSVGIIDNSYCGNNDTWKAMFYATRAGEVKAGSRLVQFRLYENQPKAVFNPVNNLYTEDRGGYGSTGK